MRPSADLPAVQNRRRAVRIVLCALAALALAGCGTTAKPAAEQSSSLPTSPGASTSAHADALVGVWAWEESCQGVVTTMKKADLSEFTAEWLVGRGFREGPKSKVAADPTPCSEATAVLHRTTEFTDGGGFVETLNGETVCDCTYRPGAPGTFVVPGDPGDPDVTVHYRADETSISFQVELPEPCTSDACRAQRSWANETFMSATWQRSSDN